MINGGYGVDEVRTMERLVHGSGGIGGRGRLAKKSGMQGKSRLSRIEDEEVCLRNDGRSGHNIVCVVICTNLDDDIVR
jgi:hypothetical protein